MSGVALACFRSALRGSWRQMTVLALLTGILGAVTLGALAGARRTDTAYGRYLAAINVSDVFVNVPGVLPGFSETDLVARISALPGVVAHATYIGLNGYPVVHGSIQLPTTAGHAMTGGDQIELGAVTLAALGKKIGDTVRIGAPPFTRTVKITGTVTLPSFGIGAAEHVSLGRGVMVPEATLLAAMGANRPKQKGGESLPVFPSAVAIDWTPGSSGAQRAALVHRVTAANPDGTPGGTYELRTALASEVVNTEQMGGQPLALGIGLAAAAVLSLALTVLSLVRRRRHELALLKMIGMTRRQVRAVVAWQTTLTLLIAVLAGGPLGILGGRLAWRAFAGSLGVAPIVEVPLTVVVLGLAAVVLAGNLLAGLPATIAARTRPATELRTE